MRWIWTSALCGSALAVPTYATTVDSAQTDSVFAAWNKPNGPGCVCGVMQQGKLVYAKGFGLADLEHNVPLTADSVFYIASTSKQFTAASIALLELEGKLALSDDVRAYLPEIRDYAAPITISHLVHHTSGVRDYLVLRDIRGTSGFDKLDNEIAMRLISRQNALNFRPGTQHLYSNSNYILLAEIVNRATGTSMSKFAKERIFTPLGMRATSFGDNAMEVVLNRVLSYSAPPNGPVVQFVKTIEAYGDGNLLTSLNDLARCDENFYSGQVGGTKLIERMRMRGLIEGGKPVDYGFGLLFGEYRGVPFEAHGGGYLGFRTELVRFPDHHLSVAVLCNVAEANPWELSQRVADLYLGDALEPVKESVAKTFKEYKLDPRSFDAYAGSYQLDGTSPRFVMNILRDGQRYFVQASNQPRIEIVPYSKNQFFMKGLDAQITFHRKGRGPVMSLTLHQNGDHRATRIEPFVPPAGYLEEFAGYSSDELEVVYRIEINDGKLVARDALLKVMTLEPDANDVFQTPHGELRFQRHATGRVEGFFLSAGRVTDLEFTRQ